ncbi:RagB/SusD family nutrient uptake outer membrane protein [Marinilabiliaceae bacterium JC017]|nr:RagB/SusD family nutrient uptake outer membrane protein [Marinilabiliaceae bacterium JC017]
MRKACLYIILLSGILFSCNDDFLDVSPRDEVSETVYWRDAKDAIAAANGVYSLWNQPGDDAFDFYHSFSDAWTDDGMCPWKWSWYYRWGQGNISPADEDNNYQWKNFYTMVRRANVFLANIHKPEMDDKLRSRLTGEILFLRAYLYHMMYYHWGEMPLVEQPLSPEELAIPRAQTGKTVAFILKDVDAAIDKLPITQSDVGRITQGAAMALKARILLFEERFGEAAKVAQDVMDLGRYDLFQTSIGTGYRDLFMTEFENSSEVIFDIQYKIPERGNSLPRWMCITGGSEQVVAPTKALVDSYETYDPVNDQLVARDPSHEFKNRDPRLEYTIVHTGSEFRGEILDSNKPPLNASVSGYGVAKFRVNEINGNNNGVDYDVNRIMIRYAEILLTYAEAKIEGGDIDQSVLDAINSVRARAYGVALAEVGKYPEITILNQDELRKIVRNERRVEFAMEGRRWYDIKRWRIAHGSNGVMNGKVFGAMVGGAYKDLGTRTFTERDYLKPVPQVQIDLTNGLYKQNPGYN